MRNGLAVDKCIFEDWDLVKKKKKNKLSLIIESLQCIFNIFTNQAEAAIWWNICAI